MIIGDDLVFGMMCFAFFNETTQHKLRCCIYILRIDFAQYNCVLYFSDSLKSIYQIL